jgi:signal transduction histidine kinase
MTGIPSDMSIKADRGHIKQILANLLANAAEATAGSGQVRISGELVKTADSRYCRLSVRDDGSGVPPAIRDKVFSPYFSTKPEGTGLGLAIVEHIVAAHGGRIHLESTEGLGTVFYIDIPDDDQPGKDTSA